MEECRRERRFSRSLGGRAARICTRKGERYLAREGWKEGNWSEVEGRVVEKDVQEEER